MYFWVVPKGGVTAVLKGQEKRKVPKMTHSGVGGRFPNAKKLLKQ